MSFLEDLKYTLQNFWRYNVKNVPQIHLAVVGAPASGKSYMLGDIMQSFACMGLMPFTLRRNGNAYSTPAQYENDVIKNGTMLKTEGYACRPENFYGAHSTNSKIEFDIDYLNIPGETFNSKSHVELFFSLYNKLNTGRKAFRVVTWERSTGDKVYIVEPLHGDTTELEAARSSNEKLLQGVRDGSYLPWGQIFAELREGGFTATAKSTIISGKTLLKNMLKYNADSVINSIGTIAVTFKLRDLDTIVKFRNFQKKIYFLNYCMNATDIVICDKMLVPKAAKDDQAGMTFHDLCGSLSQLFEKLGKGPNVYLAFRGADFLVQNKEAAYKNIREMLERDPDVDSFDEELRNTQYSVFSYAMWKYIDSRIIVKEDLKGTLGVDLDAEDHSHLVENFLNLDGHSGRTTDGALVRDYVKAHIGTKGGHMFHDLLIYAYPHLATAMPEAPIDNIVPHVYFTGTPITLDFRIYRNDPESKMARFICDDIKGDARYFDLCGSNLCFGSYQLALDILQQHGVRVNEPNDLLVRCQTTH